MGSDQSTSLPAGAPGSNLRSQRDEEIPYTQYSISKPIDGDSPRQSPRFNNRNLRTSPRPDRESTPKHDIVVVAEGQMAPKDPDPELTRLNTIPMFYPLMRGSLNIPTSTRDAEMLDKLDPRQLLFLCLRYQEHLRQLSDSTAFDQNALCIRVKEIDNSILKLLSRMVDRQKKYAKIAEQIQRVSETLNTLRKVQATMDNIVPTMERLNQLLPAEEQLEPFQMKPRSSTTASVS